MVNLIYFFNLVSNEKGTEIVCLYELSEQREFRNHIMHNKNRKLQKTGTTRAQFLLRFYFTAEII